MRKQLQSKSGTSLWDRCFRVVNKKRNLYPSVIKRGHWKSTICRYVSIYIHLNLWVVQPATFDFHITKGYVKTRPCNPPAKNQLEKRCVSQWFWEARLPLRSAKVAQSDANRLAAEPIIVSVPPRVEANARGILGLVQDLWWFLKNFEIITHDGSMVLVEKC